MSAITNSKPHHRRGNGYGVSFWAKGAASNDESADNAIVYCGPPGMPYPEFRFKLPDESFEMQRLEHALTRAFKAGDHHARAEIREVLGVRERH